VKSIYAASAFAGFLAGIGAIIFGPPIIQMSYFGLSPSAVLELLPFTATMHIGFNVFWGIIFGLLFVKFYDVIPSKSGVKKGLMWGLIYAIVPEWYMGVICFAYQPYQFGLVWAIYGPVVIIFYGLPLGYFYEGSQKPVRAEDRRKFNPFAGVVGGLFLGIVTAVFTFIGFIGGATNINTFPLYRPIQINDVAIDFAFWFIWGIIFSVLFALLYARIPGRGIRKGIYWGLILFLIATIYSITVGLLYASALVGPLIEQIPMLLILSCLVYIGYGSILGYFYRKPTR
jgi:hypothetical protein